MKFKVSPESAIRCVRFFVGPIMSWPPPLSATKSDLIFRDLLLVVAAILPISWQYPLSLTVRNSTNDMTRATKTMSIMIAMSFAVFKMFMCRYNRTQLQIYFAELEDFIKEANNRERAILERYMDKCGPLYTFIGISAVITAASICCGPILLPQPLPVDADFPFEWQNSTAIVTALYTATVAVAVQAVSAVIVDMEMALLLWFAGIQFELLAEDFTMATTLLEFNKCVEQHQKLLAATKGLISAVKYIVLGVAVITTLGNICTGYQFVHHQPIAVLAQFLFMLSVMSMEVLMYAWPADNLMATGENIAYAVYSSEWVGKSREIRNSSKIVMLRAQRPMVISIGGLLPELSMEFYGKYLTTSFSYFTTLQAVAG